MGHWTNSKQHILSAASGEVTVVGFDAEIAPGSQTAFADGLYDYAYHVNCINPSGAAGPSRLTGVVAVVRAAGNVDTIRETQSFGLIETDAEQSLSHAGRMPLSVGDEIRVEISLNSPDQPGVVSVREKQSSLTLDLVGNSPSGNFAGTSFPTSQLTAGHKFYRTDLMEAFRWEGTKWLGSVRSTGAGRNGSQAADTYLCQYGGMVTAASLGTFVPWNATITCLSWTKADINAGDIEIRRDGVSIGSVDAAAIGGGSDLNIDFDAGGVLGLFWASTKATSQIQATVNYRRRG